jgi:hypothetical protein
MQKSQDEPKSKRIKAVALCSGGLDSAIAAKIIQDQEIDVFGINFHSPFCICNSKSHSYQCGAVFFAQKIGIPIKIIPKGDDYLEIIRHPRFGYGKGMNPCVDCRIHILQKAADYAKEIGATFLITGEVLGQRPKSQTMAAIKKIDEESGLKGSILRPLSAKLFPETEVEQAGIVNRNALYDIQGRRRNILVELGRQHNLIRQYCATGGCLLTDKAFSRKLKDYFDHHTTISMSDMKYLKIGRHFRFNGTKFIVGRNESENKMLKEWMRENDYLLELKETPGPSTLIEGPVNKGDLEIGGQLTLYYSDSNQSQEVLLIYSSENDMLEVPISLHEGFNPKANQI